LARITSAAVNKFILGRIRQDTWIDLNDRAHEGYFRYTDGSHPSFKYWASGEPSGDSWWKAWRHENCVHYDEDQGMRWNDEDCDDDYYYICEFDAELVHHSPARG